MGTTMPIAITTLVGALLLGLALAPPTARAAPVVTMTPAAVPRGGTVTIAGTGFAPNAPLELFAVSATFGNARIKLADLTAGADGGFTTTTRVPGYHPTTEHSFPIVIVGAGADLAQASVAVTDAPSIAPETLTVAPVAGPVGTRFTATGAGLTPGLAVVAFTTESDKGPAGHFRQVTTLPVPADGRIVFPIDTTGYDADGYDLIVFGPGGPQIGLPLVLGHFTVTAPSTMPGLPNTGGGLASGGGRLNHAVGQR